MSRSVTSYIPTGSATVTRNTDKCALTYTARPQALTIYAQWQARLIQSYTTQSFVIVQIGSTGGSNPRAFLGVASGASEIAFVAVSSTGGSVTAGINPSVSVGKIIEARGLLYADGSVQVGASVAGATETLSTKVTGKVLPPTWAAQKLIFGTFNNFAFGLMKVAIARGNQSMATMRRIVGNQAA